MQRDYDVFEIDIAEDGVPVAAFGKWIARMVVKVRGDERVGEGHAAGQRFYVVAFHHYIGHARFRQPDAAHHQPRLFFTYKIIESGEAGEHVDVAQRVGARFRAPSGKGPHQKLGHPQQRRHSHHQRLERNTKHHGDQFVVPVTERLGKYLRPLDHENSESQRIEPHPLDAEQPAELHAGQGRAHGGGKRIDNKDCGDGLLYVVAEGLPYGADDLAFLGKVRDPVLIKTSQ